MIYMKNTSKTIDRMVLPLFVVVTLFLLLSCNSDKKETPPIHGQNKLPEIYLNHLYVVLDSNTLLHLADSSFISEKFGNIKVHTATTATESWSGIYLFGKNSYFEFFSTKGYKGATLNDFGLVFMTARSNEIWKIKKHWRENSNDSIVADTVLKMQNGKHTPWFYNLSLLNKDSVQPFSTFLMENTPEELSAVGFSAEEIKNGINWPTYSIKRTKAEFTKSFNQIQSVTLLINKKEYNHLKKSFLGFGLQQKGTTFFNKQIKIICIRDEKFTARLKTIETALTGLYAKTDIKISDKLIVHVNGSKAIWEIRY